MERKKLVRERVTPSVAVVDVVAEAVVVGRELSPALQGFIQNRSAGFGQAGQGRWRERSYAAEDVSPARVEILCIHPC